MPQPRTSDGKPINLVNMFPGGVYASYAGCEDDVVGAHRWGGDLFQLQSTIIEDKVETYQFMEWIYLAGGLFQFTGAGFGDWANYRMYAPTSPATENVGAGAYSKTPNGYGSNLFVPGGGNWDLDLSEKIGNSAVTKVSPVPSFDAEGHGTGFFDWDTDTGTVTLNASQQGGYHLFDADFELATYAPKVPMLNGNHYDFVVPNVKPKKILPHWLHEVKLHNSTVKEVVAVWVLFLARQHTQSS